ncbi:MAG: iron-containing alcohol dehydrogenase [Erysipelotrichaceae bacterium]
MLNNYVQYNPNKIIFGKDSDQQVGKLIKELGCKRVLIHYDNGDFIKPLIEKVRANISKEGIEVFELGGVVPNPKLSLMKKGCQIVRENDIDFILAVGGGSTMDSSKYIALGAYYQGDLFNHPKFAKIETPVLKHGVIVTMPGTGSDVSTAAVWRDDTVNPERKTCVFADEMRFDFSIINPELTYSLPKFQTAAGCFDIISHCMEDYFCAPQDSEFYLAAYEGVINDVMINVRKALVKPDDYTARANIARCAYLPLEDVITMGAIRGYCVHNLEKPMTGMFHRTHGEMLAILFPAWMQYCYKRNLPLFVRLSVKCFGAKMNYANPEETVLEGIKNLRNFIKEIGLPQYLSEVNITEDCFEQCAERGILDSGVGYIGRAIQLTKQDIIEVYKLAK